MYRPWMPFVCLFLAALITTLATTPIAYRIAWHVNAVDYPSARRVNKTPIPRMGGIAIFCGITCAFLVLALGTTQFKWPIDLTPAPHFSSINYWMLVLSFVAIFITGILDDLFSLKPLQKLVGQVIAASIAVAGGLVIGSVVNPFDGTAINMGALTYPVTVVYLVAYVNIINLIDGLDGLAAGISCIASLTMFSLAVMAGRTDAAALAISITGATLGFLRYNFNPASIFMGDSGSLLLGFALGVTSLLSVTRIAGLTTIIVPLVVAAVPIIDTFSAIVRRARAHVSVGHADRGHIHHRLMDEGFDQRQTVLVIYAWTALLGLGAIALTKVTVGPRIAIFCVLVGASVAFAQRLHLFRPVLLHHFDPQTGDDEIVDPSDPSFQAEEERFEESEEEHHHLL